MSAEAEHTEVRVDEIVEGGSSVGAAVLRLIAAAERGGYKRAIAALRDDDRYRNWWSKLPPNHPETRYWDFGRQQLADYLESLTTEGTKS